MNRLTDLSAYLRSRGLSDDTVYKNPEAAAELSRISFLEENSVKAQRELRNYAWIVLATPITAPALYLVAPSRVTLCCSIAFAAIVLATCIAQILRLRRTTKDYIKGMERLVAIVRKGEQ